jgi:hypothetical protein
MLENVRIASPCSASWENMSGNDRVRDCSACNLSVYNFSAMTEQEIAALMAGREGRLCARLFRRADGTVLTRNCPVGVKSIVRRLSRIAGAILSLMSPGIAEAQAGQGYVKTNISGAALELYVTDPSGAPVRDAVVNLWIGQTDKRLKKKTDSLGRVRLFTRAGGAYHFQVNATGFSVYDDSTQLRSGEMLSMRVVLPLTASVGVVVLVQPFDLQQVDAVARHNLVPAPPPLQPSLPARRPMQP